MIAFAKERVTAILRRLKTYLTRTAYSQIRPFFHNRKLKSSPKKGNILIIANKKEDGKLCVTFGIMVGI
jgi:hypothetical protein